MSASKEVIIENILYPYSDTWDKSNMHVTFTISNINYSMANSIRRAMISYVPTLCFNSEPYESSTINIIRNDSKLNNEIIKHRLSKIPINIKDPSTFDREDYIFYLEYENKTHDMILVTTEHFNIKKISTNKFLPRSEVMKYLPPDPLTGEYVPIVRLLPKHYTHLNHDITTSKSIAESIKIPVSECIGIKLECKLMLNNGIYNAGYSPVAVSAYKNTIDKEKSIQGEIDYIDNIQSDEREKGLTLTEENVLKKRYNINQIQRYFKTDEYDEPNSFDFRIESVGVIPPLIIFERACNLLINELKKLIINIETRNENAIIIKPNVEFGGGSYNLHIFESDDTIGNLVQTHCSQYFADYSLPINKRKCSVITYHKIHPLKLEIMISVKPMTSTNDYYENCKEIIGVGCKLIIKNLMEIIKELQNKKEFIIEVKSLN
jgi:hypothetical protein